MEFSTSKHNYSVADIYDLFIGRLPVVVMVTQGFYGDIADDTFDRGEVLAITAVSRQKRVVGHLNLHGRPTLITIPEDYKEQLCIVQNGKVMKEESLRRIIESNTLPIIVQFPKDKVLTVATTSVSTNHIPPIKIDRRFDEVYLLGHIIIKGEITANVIRVPLYLSDLRLSPVSGIKRSQPEKWKMFFDNLKRKSSRIAYNQHYGNPGIAVFDPDAMYSKDTKFSYVQPQSYSSIVGLVQGPLTRPRPGLQFHPQSVLHGICEKDKPLHQSGGSRLPPPPHDKTFRPLPTSTKDSQPLSTITTKRSRPEPQPHVKGFRPLPSPQTKEFRPLPQLPTLENNMDEMKNMYITPVPPKITARFENPNTHEIENDMARKSSPIPDYKRESVSSLPDRGTASGMNGSDIDQHEKSPKYINNIPRTSVSPAVHLQNTVIGKSLPHVQNQDTKIYTRNQSVKEVEKLSIREVCEYLEILNLGQYCQSFKEQLIDGSLLVGLTETMLTEDFGMKRVEAFRLLKFARESYIPA